MSPDQITAILSLLFAFGVPQITIDQIRVEITPVAATSTISYVPVIQTPIRENQPIYFGSTPVTVINPPAPPIVQTEPIPEPVKLVPFRIGSMAIELFRTGFHGSIADGYYLEMYVNKPLDFAKTTFSNGQSLGIIIVDGEQAPYTFGVAERQITSYHYEAAVKEPSKSVTIYGTDGDTLTREL